MPHVYNHHFILTVADAGPVEDLKDRPPLLVSDSGLAYIIQSHHTAEYTS